MYVEELSKRTQKSKHFFDADTGKHRAEFTIHDRHYKDDFDDWIDVDENLEDDGLDGFTHKCEKVRHKIRFDGDGKRRWYPRRNVDEYVEFGRLEFWTGTQWNNVLLGTPTRENNQIKWSTTNFDLTVTNTWRKVKLEAVLKTDAAKRRLRWAVSLHNLTWNSWNLLGQDNEVAGSIEKPVAWDANGSHDNPNVTITYSYSGGYVEFGGDLSSAVLPITIDPTFTDGFGGDITTYKDTMVSRGNDNNYGADTSIKIIYGWNGVDGFEQMWRGLIEFDLSSIPSASTCSSANLYLYWLYGNSTSGDADFYSIASGNGDWIEGTKSYATAGAGEPCWDYKEYNTGGWAGSAGLMTANTDYVSGSIGTHSFSSGDTEGHEYIISLTSSVIEDWFGETNTNYGILYAVRDAGSNTRQLEVYSSDHPTTGYRPKLVVEYSESSVPVITNTVVETTPVVVVDWC